MKALKPSLIYGYVYWLIAGVGFYLIRGSGIFNNPLFFSLAFIYLILLPGWLINRFLRLDLGSLVGRVLVYFVFSVSFYFIFNLLAIFTGLSLTLISNIIGLAIGLIFIGAIVYDSLKKEEINDEDFDWQKLFKLENIYYLIPLVIGIFILWIIYLRGPSLDGDPYFHLSIIRKALDGDSLSTRALAFTKTQIINSAYVYPAWHVFLGFISKLFKVDIFTTWTNVLYVLTLLTFTVWYKLAWVIFKNKAWAVLGLTLMMIFVFYGGPGYLFSRLGVPDTLAQYIFLPLGWFLVLFYIFEAQKKDTKKFMLVNFLAALILLSLHGIHYFYLVISILFFGLLYAIFHFKDLNYREIVLRIIKVFSAEIIALIIVGLAIQIHSGTILQTLSDFAKSEGGVIFSTNFFKFGFPYQYGFLLVPALLIVLIKNRRFLFILALMLLTPLIYWTPLKNIFNQAFSGVFTHRLPANTALYFFVFTIVLGGIIYLLDTVSAKISVKYRFLVDVFLGAIFLILAYFETKVLLVSNFTYDVFYSKLNTFDDHYLWFLAGSIFMGLILLFYFQFRRKKGECDFSFQDNLTAFLLMVIFSYALISPSIINRINIINAAGKLTGEAYFTYLVRDDSMAIEFTNQELPQNSVILAGSAASKGLSTLTDQYMAYNSGSAYEETFKWVFDGKNPDSAKAEIVTASKWAIDYIYLDDPQNQNSHFRQHPEQYQLIYNDSRTEIYRLKR